MVVLDGWEDGLGDLHGTARGDFHRAGCGGVHGVGGGAGGDNLEDASDSGEVDEGGAGGDSLEDASDSGEVVEGYLGDVAHAVLGLDRHVEGGLPQPVDGGEVLVVEDLLGVVLEVQALLAARLWLVKDC